MNDMVCNVCNHINNIHRSKLRETEELEVRTSDHHQIHSFIDSLTEEEEEEHFDQIPVCVNKSICSSTD